MAPSVRNENLKDGGWKHGHRPRVDWESVITGGTATKREDLTVLPFALYDDAPCGPYPTICKTNVACRSALKLVRGALHLSSLMGKQAIWPSSTMRIIRPTPVYGSCLSLTFSNIVSLAALRKTATAKFRRSWNGPRTRGETASRAWSDSQTMALQKLFRFTPQIKVTNVTFSYLSL